MQGHGKTIWKVCSFKKHFLWQWTCQISRWKNVRESFDFLKHREWPGTKATERRVYLFDIQCPCSQPWKSHQGKTKFKSLVQVSFTMTLSITLCFMNTWKNWSWTEPCRQKLKTQNSSWEAWLSKTFTCVCSLFKKNSLQKKICLKIFHTAFYFSKIFTRMHSQISPGLLFAHTPYFSDFRLCKLLSLKDCHLCKLPSLNDFHLCKLPSLKNFHPHHASQRLSSNMLLTSQRFSPNINMLPTSQRLSSNMLPTSQRLSSFILYFSKTFTQYAPYFSKTFTQYAPYFSKTFTQYAPYFSKTFTQYCPLPLKDF